jgi:aminobenzoyl-glutamate utilization protein B
MEKQMLDTCIDEREESFIKASDQIWAAAETRFDEYKSAEILQNLLKEAGFSVQQGLGGIDTAFVGSFGSGHPVIALLGEYDALSGLSQQSGVCEPSPIKAGGNGHGCGHNMLGTGALAAAIAVKEYLVKYPGSGGTIRYYGCPGEEGGSGKTFMARDGVFDGVDLALTWHPQTYTGIYSMRTLANFQVYFKFHGKSAHAGVAPHLGRSALDAVELMNVGANYLREHIIPGARLHYAVTNTGGLSPNVVQAEAEVVYLLRAPKIKQVREIYARVCDIAQGAALMTGTSCEICFNKACSDYIPNNALEKIMYENLCSVGAPVWTEENIKTAHEFQATITPSELENDLNIVHELTQGKDKDILLQLKNTPLSPVVLPYVYNAALQTGSTDVGDVSWIVPTAQLNVACQAFGTPGHSWQNVAQGTLPAAHRGMLLAAKVLARTTIDVLQNPELVQTAKKELEETLAGEKYSCPIPEEIQPSHIQSKN